MQQRWFAQDLQGETGRETGGPCRICRGRLGVKQVLNGVAGRNEELALVLESEGLKNRRCSGEGLECSLPPSTAVAASLLPVLCCLVPFKHFSVYRYDLGKWTCYAYIVPTSAGD